MLEHASQSWQDCEAIKFLCASLFLRTSDLHAVQLWAIMRRHFARFSASWHAWHRYRQPHHQFPALYRVRQIRHQAACLSDQQHTGCDIPQAEPAFPKTVITPCSNKARSSAAEPNRRTPEEDCITAFISFRNLASVSAVPRPKKDACGKQAICHAPAARYTNAPII